MISNTAVFHSIEEFEFENDEGKLRLSLPLHSPLTQKQRAILSSIGFVAVALEWKLLGPSAKEKNYADARF